MTPPEFNPQLNNKPVYQNRGLDTKFDSEIDAPLTVTLHTIDSSLLKHLAKSIRAVVTQDGKQIQVPVIYGNPERWKSAQIDGSIRDKNGKLILPIVMIRRTFMKRSAINNPVNKHHSYLYKTKWNSRNIYDRFSVVNNVIPSEVYHTSVVPDYYDITYEAMIWTEYMEQMNSVVEDISFESYEYWGEKQGYKFNVKIDQIENITELTSNNDRVVRSKFQLNVHSYIIPKSMLDNNGNRVTTNKLVYSPKKVVFNTEVVTDLNK